jgi:hypothetical protein
MNALLKSISPITFFGSAAIALCLIVFASVRPEAAAAAFDSANAWIIAEAGWFYLLSVGIFALRVPHGDGVADFVYSVRAVEHRIPAYALADAARRERGNALYYRVEAGLSAHGSGYDIYGYDAEQLIADVLAHYDRFRNRLYAAPA